MKLSLERQIPLAFGLTLVLLITISIFAYQRILSLTDAVKWEKHTQEVLLQLDSTLASLVDAETATRGYALTHDESYLIPLNRTQQTISEEIKHLRELTADNNDQTEKVDEIEKLANEKLSVMQNYVDKARLQDVPAMNEQLKSGRGKILMDQIRAVIDSLKAEEKSLLAAREINLNDSIKGTYRILILGGFAGVISLVLANLAIFREIGKRSKAEDALKDANLDLENRVERRTHELGEINLALKTEAERREKSEETARQSEVFTRSILDSLPAHIAVLDKGGKVVAVNQAWNNFAKANSVEDEIGATGIGQNYIAICEKFAAFEKDTADVLGNLREIINGRDKEFSYEYPCHSPNEERWFLMQASKMHGSEGGAVVSHVNITDRKVTEKTLVRQQENFRALVQGISQAVWTADENGLSNETHEWWENLTGQSQKESGGWGWLDALHPEDREKAQIAWEFALETKTNFSAEYRIRSADGSYGHYAVRGVPVFNADGSFRQWIGTITDISERKEAESEREQLLLREQNARKDAEIANRMRDEFLATVSHELRAPLNSILGWARLLEKDQLDDVTKRKATQTIVRNADAQSRLIEDLLDVSRIITGKLRLEVTNVKPASFVEAALETVRPAAEAKNISLEVFEDSGVSHISGDPNRLQQVVWNLLSNAIKFTPNDGRVSVEIARADSQVAIRIKDTGIGIKKEFLPNVFDRFSQADASSIRKFGGLGLGLAIVRHLTEMHGGTVEVESPGENKGAVFTVKLPVNNSLSETETNSDSAPLNLETKANLNLDGLLILAVDDEEDTRHLLVQALTQYGATVTTADSAENALQIISGQKPDVLVSDIGMPYEDGYALIRKVRTLEIDIPAIALTGFTRAQDRMRALEAGFQNHVSKPFEPDELVTVIASLTGRL